MYSLRCAFLSMLFAGALVTLPAAACVAAQPASSEGSVTIGTVQPRADEADKTALKAAPATEPTAQAAPVAAPDPVAGKTQPARAQNESQAEDNMAASAAEEKPKGFVPSVALVRHLVKETELPAMRLSLGLVNFVGEVEGSYPGEDSFAILPLGHDAVVEVYELNYDGKDVLQARTPSVVREMGANEAYVLRVPYVAGHPTREICVKTDGRRHCWRPGSGELGEGFLSWKRTKGME